jgi:argonaute-like protein implicated in RNA metabolism and viral defense
MEERYALREFNAELELFSGRSADDYREAALRAAQPRQDRARPGIVFLVTRHDDRYARRGGNCYLMGKATLANVALPSQAVTIETLRQPDNSWQWSVQSIALQTYAKVGNIPFVLHDAVGVRELVIGVGRSDLVDQQQGYVRQIFGAAACFRQDGDFLYAGSTVPVAEQHDYENMLAELLTNFIERFEREQGTLERLVLHIFKKTGRRELSAVERALDGREIPFALLHVNRDTPLWLVTEDEAHHEPALPGAQVALADHDRLLMTGEVSRKKRNAHPLRLALDRNSTFREMDRLAEQLQGFTATSWRGFHRTNEPSTILYGRLLAEKVTQLIPYGFRPDLAVAMGDRPWFL